jgi:DNA-binding MarR family transcriptional regulator
MVNCDKNKIGVGVMTKIDEGNSISEAFDLFIQAASLTQKYADSAFYRKAGISIPKYAVMQILANADNPVTPSELSRRMIKERHDITTLMRRMNRDGLIDITPNALDRRSVIITLTEKGREKLVQAKPIAEEIANQVMLKLSNNNLASMTKSLNTLKQNAFNGIDKFSKTPRKYY